jgi:PEP-CTERM motif-containing protein
MFPIRSLVPALCGFFMFSSAQASPVTIDFDSLPGMLNSPGTSVPLASQLSDQFLSTLGVSFSSQANYVAVVEHSTPPGCPGPSVCPTVSMPNVIGGVKSDGTLSYGTPITISFFDLTNPTIKGITDFVSIRGDMIPLPGASATIEAFDALGQSLGSVSAFDSTVGLTLSINAQGIHSLVLTQNSAGGPYDGTIGFDNLQFNGPQVPEPASLVLLGSGLMGLLWLRNRCRKH